MNKIANRAGTDLGLTTVVDAHPRLWCEFVLWVLCANQNVSVPKRVYFVGDVPVGLIQFARRAGVSVRHAAPLIGHSPHCNKLIPFLDRDGFRDQIVTDSDVFATDDVSKFFRFDQIRLPPNNHGVPPLPVFQALFNEVGSPQTIEPGLSIFPGGYNNMETFAYNVSAGLICIPSGLRDFVKIWQSRAEWFGENLDLLGMYKGHIDQISFAIAAAQEEIPFSHFPAQANAVLQLLPHIKTLYALHLTSGHIPNFAHAFDDKRHLKLDWLPTEMHPKIEEFNSLFDEALIILNQIPETQNFAQHLLSPAYNRNK
jgi:hypothetical protein